MLGNFYKAIRMSNRVDFCTFYVFSIVSSFRLIETIPIISIYLSTSIEDRFHPLVCFGEKEKGGHNFELFEVSEMFKKSMYKADFRIV